MEREGDLYSPGLAILRIFLFAGLTLPCMAVQTVLVAVRSPARKIFPLWYHRRAARLLGLRIIRRGRPSKTQPTLFIVNHVSYFDISVLGALIKGSFVAKAEIAEWPFFGWLAKLQRSVFIDRQRGAANQHRDDMVSRLEAGDNLILFPEGTSSDGNRVLRFKSALFAVASLKPMGAPLTVQPVSITYTRLDGMPMGRWLRPFFSWYGDMDLGPHVLNALGMGKVTVMVQFHEPVTLTDFKSRKALADHCYRKVSEGVASALAGRPQLGPENLPVPAPRPAEADAPAGGL